MEEDKICHPEKKINKDLLKVKNRENEKNMRVQEIIATREIIGYTLLSHFFIAFILSTYSQIFKFNRHS